MSAIAVITVLNVTIDNQTSSPVMFASDHASSGGLKIDSHNVSPDSTALAFVATSEGHGCQGTVTYTTPAPNGALCTEQWIPGGAMTLNTFVVTVTSAS